MELFAIALSVPAALVASTIYCLLIAKIVRRFERIGRLLWWVSAAVLGAFAIEVLLLTTMGAIRARAALGPTFYVAHIVTFFLGTPALANVLLLKRGTMVRWYLVIPLCTVFAFVLVLLQYGVSEALYGIDGVDGPFSECEAGSHEFKVHSTRGVPSRHAWLPP